ncbi:MAG: hypothetical protein KA713_08960 [Chryseotalea sp. WA131a]|nr:MAG: hypothetical protein KA713_08960 [Chryseotalea sp. WA131a]
MIQKKSPALQAGLDHSSRLNVTLAGCSSAEPASVSVQLCKIQNSNLYLQPVKILSHLPFQSEYLMNGLYKIFGIESDNLSEFQQSDIVDCETIDGELVAVRLIERQTKI